MKHKGGSSKAHDQNYAICVYDNTPVFYHGTDRYMSLPFNTCCYQQNAGSGLSEK